MQTRSELLADIERLESELKFRKADLHDLDAEVRQLYNDSIDPNAHNLHIRSWGELKPTEQEQWREKLKRSKMTKEDLLAENDALRKQLEEQSAYYAQQDERNRRDEQYQLDRYAGQD